MLVKKYNGVSLTNQSVLIDVISQLNKDLVLSGFNFVFDVNSNFDFFYSELTKWLELVIVKEKNLFFSLLYRIDIQERKVLNAANNSINKIALLIIEREFHKVVLKQYYKEQSNGLNKIVFLQEIT